MYVFECLTVYVCMYVCNHDPGLYDSDEEDRRDLRPARKRAVPPAARKGT